MAEAVRIGQPDSSNVLWSGVLQKSRMLFFFIVVNGDVAGMIHTQRETFAIKPLGAGHHVLIHLDPSKFGPVDPHEAVPKNQQNQNPDRPASGRELSKSTSPPVIDLLVAYTQAVLDANPNIWSLIAASEASANEILSNSGNDERVEVVHTVQVSYTEFGNAETDCNRLQNPSDGYMDNIHSLRDQYGADVVVLLIDDWRPPWLGWAYDVPAGDASEAFCVLEAGVAVTDYTFAHEVAHLVGARHEYDPAGTYEHAVYTWPRTGRRWSQAGAQALIEYRTGPIQT